MSIWLSLRVYLIAFAIILATANAEPDIAHQHKHTHTPIDELREAANTWTILCIFSKREIDNSLLLIIDHSGNVCYASLGWLCISFQHKNQLFIMSQMSHTHRGWCLSNGNAGDVCRRLVGGLRAWECETTHRSGIRWAASNRICSIIITIKHNKISYIVLGACEKATRSQHPDWMAECFSFIIIIIHYNFPSWKIL